MQQVEAFDQVMVNQLEIMREQNNLYGSLLAQEQQCQMQINGIKKVLHDLNHGKVKPENLLVPYGMGQFRRLTGADKKELVDTYLRQLSIEENKLKSLEGQRLHRADEVGEQRVKVLRQLWFVITHQHRFNDEELYAHMKEYNDTVLEKPYMRPEDAVHETIRKAQDVKI